MIEIKELEVEYKKKKVLKAVDLEVGTGVYGLLGPNGAGKTTLMRCITGILKPYSGEIICMEKIGYLPQKFGFYKQMTVFETLKFFATLKKVDELEQKEHIMECLKLVHLIERANDKMGTLSGGMVRRVGIAQALLGNPKVMIFDEPTAGLDPEERFRFRQLIRQIREGRCIIISTGCSIIIGIFFVQIIYLLLI